MVVSPLARPSSMSCWPHPWRITDKHAKIQCSASPGFDAMDAMASKAGINKNKMAGHSIKKTPILSHHSCCRSGSKTSTLFHRSILFCFIIVD